MFPQTGIFRDFFSSKLKKMRWAGVGGGAQRSLLRWNEQVHTAHGRVPRPKSSITRVGIKKPTQKKPKNPPKKTH